MGATVFRLFRNRSNLEDAHDGSIDGIAASSAAKCSGEASSGEGAFLDIQKDWWTYQFWRFVFVQQEVAVLAKTAIEFPPMQPGASFNLEAVKEKVEKALASRTGQ